MATAPEGLEDYLSALTPAQFSDLTARTRPPEEVDSDAPPSDDLRDIIITELTKTVTQRSTAAAQPETDIEATPLNSDALEGGLRAKLGIDPA